MRTRRYWLPEAEESIMSALIAALYADHQTADRVRLRLSTGDIAFPADRVHLTSISEPGHAGLVPAESFALKLRAYFQTLFDRDEEAGRVLSLGAAVQARPRSSAAGEAFGGLRACHRGADARACRLGQRFSSRVEGRGRPARREPPRAVMP
jgi:hypothetical protein